MLKYKADYQYLVSEGIKLFTVVLLPEEKKKFPVVIIRTPYVEAFENSEECDVTTSYLNEYKVWLKNGYAVVVQHCRGTGKSDGDCIPYVNERADGLNLLDWIRNQHFYDGELFLKGNSYLSSVHYLTAPFADDIKGAIFAVQDTNRYNICYRNGFLKKGLHGSWFVGMYKRKSHMKKNYTNKAFDLLPLKDFSQVVFGESVASFDEVLKNPTSESEFWNTALGGVDSKNVTDNLKFPVLYTTGFYDIYTGGIFDMWKNMSEESRNMAALVVSPYNHSDSFDSENSMFFPVGTRIEKFGENYEIKWLNFIRGKAENCPFEQGKITYYRLFDNKWTTEKHVASEKRMEVSLGEDEISYKYNPYDAPTFKGGLSCAFGGSAFQDKPNSRHDIISVYSKPFENNVFVKGKMQAKLTVKSDCDDTCFYVRVSIEKEGGDFGLRDDITSLVYQLGNYISESIVKLDFNFDEHAFLIKKGERLRVDIASANNEYYVRHTNQKGLYCEQTTAKVANNTVYLKESALTLPIE